MQMLVGIGIGLSLGLLVAAILLWQNKKFRKAAKAEYRQLEANAFEAERRLRDEISKLRSKASDRIKP